MPYSPTTARPGLNVAIRRDSSGVIRRYYDPDTGETLTRTDAIMRMKVDFERGTVVDSLGNPITNRELMLNRSEATRRFMNVSQSTRPLNRDVMQYQPKPNEEIIERLIVQGKDGKIHKIDISYGSGKRYSPHEKGSAFRTKISDALDLEADYRLPTSDLQRVVISKQFVVRTTS